MVYFNKDHSGIGMQTWSVSDMTTAGSWFNYGTGPESSILGTKSGSCGVKPLILNDYLYSPHTLKFCCKTCVEKQFFIYLLPTVGQELDPYQKFEFFVLCVFQNEHGMYCTYDIINCLPSLTRTITNQ